MARRWIHEREFAASRVDWIVAGMSRRTQESCAAVRQGREPNFNQIGIILEDVRYHIQKGEGEQLRGLMLRKYIELKFDGTQITIGVLDKNDVWIHESFTADEDTIEWAFALYADVLHEVAQ